MLATTIEKPTALSSEPTTKAEYHALLTPKERELSQQLGQAFYDGSRKSIEGIKEAGEALLLAKSKLKGKFDYFCKYELPLNISKDTVENFMRTATAIQQNPSLAKFNPTIIFELSKRSTPPKVVEEMKALAESDQHQDIKVKDVKAKIQEAKGNTIKKGDIVEWQHDYKGYTFGRVKSKSPDGLTCKIESLTIPPFSLGEKPTQFLRHCPIQKNNAENTISEYFARYKIEPGAKVVIKPYTTQLQSLLGEVGTVIVRYPEKRIFSVQVKGVVKDFFWEELEHHEEEQQKEEDCNVIDVKPVEPKVVESEIKESESLICSTGIKEASICINESNAKSGMLVTILNSEGLWKIDNFKDGHAKVDLISPERHLPKRRRVALSNLRVWGEKTEIKSEITEIEDDEPLLISEDLKSASDYQLSDLLAKLSLEIRGRISAKTKSELDALVDQAWKEIEHFSQQRKEQFLVLLIDKSNCFE